VKIPQIAQVLFIIAASFFVYGFVSMAKDGEVRRACGAVCAIRPNYAGQDRRAPDFALKNLDGKTVRMSDFRGKAVILNFWSKSCPPCLEEMPSLAQLGHQLRGRDDVALLTITTDESAEDARNTLRSILGEDAPFEVLVDSDTKVVGDLFGTKLYPETWFVDPQGVIRARVDGARDWSSPLSLEFAESLLSPLTCSIDFKSAKPQGPSAHLCAEMGR
jgi:peroxiredoxin